MCIINSLSSKWVDFLMKGIYNRKKDFYKDNPVIVQQEVFMKNNLLFINQSQEIIQEFLEAMRGDVLEFDSADNGRKAVSLL